MIYFGASWCGPCKEFRPIVKQVTDELGIEVQWVDIDTEAGLLEGMKHRVVTVPSLIYNGETRVGNFGETNLREWLSAKQA